MSAATAELTLEPSTTLTFSARASPTLSTLTVPWAWREFNRELTDTPGFQRTMTSLGTVVGVLAKRGVKERTLGVVWDA
ncbi:unannotated protein [freshwater metagenome]|uniref:Unannotated protein n=1 Tax=freshwater metagenome TaxID=449393 RepID=A0A6J6C1E4_9ZZZZ